MAIAAYVPIEAVKFPWGDTLRTLGPGQRWLSTLKVVDDQSSLPLTTREREVVDLVKAGKSTNEIADILTVSIRTVEGHIYRACMKLDVVDRDDLKNIELDD